MTKYETKAGLAHFDFFTVAGVTIITDNQKGTDDINALWQHFFESNIGQKLENQKEDDTIYAVYSDYEGDHTKPYRLTIGYKLKKGQRAPADLHSVQIENAEYALLSTQGPQPAALIDGWTAIWQGELDRRFKTDFEIYGPRFFQEGLNEILICIGVNT
jgi:predicted transcriptional regulator YdeE